MKRPRTKRSNNECQTSVFRFNRQENSRPEYHATRRAGVVARLAVVFSALVLVACEGDTRSLEEAVLGSDLQLNSLSIVPVSGESQPLVVNSGRQVQFSVSGSSSLGLPLSIEGDDRRWSSSRSSVGSVTDAGLFTALSDGETDISVRIAGVDATPFRIQVSNAELAAVTEINGPVEVSSCSVASYTARGMFSDGSTRSLADVTWSLDPAPMGNSATDNTLGLTTTSEAEVEARGPGVFSLVATQDGTSFSLPVTVLDDLQSLTINGVPTELSNNETVSLTATADSLNENTSILARDVSDVVFWQVTASRNIAVFDRAASGGQLTGLVAGVGEVEAFCGNAQASVPLTVVEDNFVSFTVSPSGAQTIGPGQDIIFTASAIPFGDDEAEDVTERVEWSISNSDVAELGVDGDEVEVTGRRAGTAILVAEFANERLEITITVQ